MVKEKNQDEIFCRSCGEIIKKEAEICPHCGVRNIPSKASYGTCPSSNWYHGVVGFWILWVIIISSIIQSVDHYSIVNIAVVGGFFVLIPLIGLPVSLSHDIKYVKANNEKWNPNTALWIIGSITPYINIVITFIYLVKRYNIMNKEDIME